MDTRKQQLKDYYNKNAQDRDSSQKQDWKIELRKNFLNIMKDAGLQKLLEIGAGTGQDSQFFMQNNLDVTAVDLSESHVTKCREKGINAHVMDFSNMTFDDNTFDCLYAMNCLLHVANDDITQVLGELRRVVKTGGYMFMCQYGTSDKHYDEGVRCKKDKGDRFFSFRSFDYFKQIIQSVGLDIIESDCFEVGEEKYNVQYFVIINRAHT